MTRTDANKTLVVDFIYALFTKGEASAIDRCLTSDFVNNDPFPGMSGDREGFRQTAETFRSAFPDWHSDVETLVAEGDLVMERFTARGTHHGPFMGAAPTGRKVALAGINLFRIADGRIAERWGRTDDLGLLQQLGIIPSLVRT